MAYHSWRSSAGLFRSLPARADVMSVVIVVTSLLLWWACRFRAGSLPAIAPWDFSFSWFYATAFPLLWYHRGLRLTAAADRPSPWRVASFLLGMAAIYAVLQTRFEYLAEHMFFLNRFQHVVMHHLGPFLIALAWPWPVLERGMPVWARRAVASGPARWLLRVMRRPILAAVLFVGLIAFWLVPAIHFRAMLDPAVYLAMNWSMVGDGILFWSLVLDPRDAEQAHISFGFRAALAVGVIFPQILMGAIITLSHTDYYRFYAWCGRIYPSIGALDDQTFGGMIIWMPPSMMGVIALLLVLNTLRLHDEAHAVTSGTGAISASSWTGR